MQRRKRIVSVMVLLAILAAALGPVAMSGASAATIPCAMMMSASVVDDHSSDGDQSSKGTLAPCGSGVRCIIAISLPAPFAPTEIDLPWQSVRYWGTSRSLAGLSVPPDISPPIARA